MSRSKQLLLTFSGSILMLGGVLLPAGPMAAQDQPKAGEQSKPSENPRNSIDWKKGGTWSALAEYIGTYQVEDLLAEPRVKRATNAYLKGQSIDLNSIFNATAPIGFEDDCLILQGSPTGQADERGGYMNICIYNGETHLALKDKDGIRVYSGVSSYQFLPEGMRNWIYFNSHPDINRNIRPENVQMVPSVK